MAVGGVCWREWRQDDGGNISLSISVDILVSSVRHFFHEDGTPGYMETECFSLTLVLDLRLTGNLLLLRTPPSQKIETNNQNLTNMNLNSQRDISEQHCTDVSHFEVIK